MIRWGFSSLGCSELSLTEMVKMADKYGYELLELRTLNGSLNLVEELSKPSEAEVLKELVKANRAEVFGGSFGIVSDGHDREDLLKMARCADEFGIKYIRIFGGAPYAEGLDDLKLRRAEENWRWWNTHKFNCQLALETHDLLSAAQRCVAVFEALGTALPVVWDVHHTRHIGGESIYESFDLLKNHLAELHVKDCLPDNENKCNLVLPGTGEFPGIELLDLMEKNRTETKVILEHEKHWHPHLPSMPEALEAVNKYWRNQN